MNKKSIIILVIAIILVIIAIVLYIVNKPIVQEERIIEESKTEDIDNVIYDDFVVYNENKEEIKLSDANGSPVMILFWSPENQDSVEVLKKVNEMYEKYNETIKFYMISNTEDIDETLKNELSIEIYYDLYQEATRKYSIKEYPSMIYITEDNKIMNSKSGFTTTDALEANLDILSNNI